MSDWKSLAIILPNSVRWWMVDGDGDDVVGWYDINYIYRRMTPRFVDYDEVGAGKIKQSSLEGYRLHISLDDSDICRL